MSRCRLVSPEIVRLQLSDGDFLDVKKTLNAGEYRDLIAGMAAPSHFGEAAVVDMTKVGMTKILQYLLGWSLVGFDAQPLPYSVELPEATRVATLRSLDAETFTEITEAIEAHEERERAAKKKGPALERKPSTTLPSVV